jgi:hypothetical protein
MSNRTAEQETSPGYKTRFSAAKIGLPQPLVCQKKAHRSENRFNRQIKISSQGYLSVARRKREGFGGSVAYLPTVQIAMYIADISLVVCVNCGSEILNCIRNQKGMLTMLFLAINLCKTKTHATKTPGGLGFIHQKVLSCPLIRIIKPRYCFFMLHLFMSTRPKTLDSAAQSKQRLFFRSRTHVARFTTTTQPYLSTFTAKPTGILAFFRKTLCKPPYPLQTGSCNRRTTWPGRCKACDPPRWSALLVELPQVQGVWNQEPRPQLYAPSQTPFPEPCPARRFPQVRSSCHRLSWGEQVAGQWGEWRVVEGSLGAGPRSLVKGPGEGRLRKSEEKWSWGEKVGFDDVCGRECVCRIKQDEEARGHRTL